MMKVLFITNIPAPYRIDFYNELGKSVDLTVIFESKSAEGIRFNWNINEIKNFKAIFLSEGNINEKKVDWKILKYIKKNEYDHIVATSYSYFTEMIALIFMKIKNIPYYLETDGGLIREENKIKRLYKRFLISGAKGYFSPSEASDEYLIFYGADKNKIYRYPFTSLKEKDILSKKLNSKDKKYIKKQLRIKEEKIILSVGQFIYRKGYDVLLNSIEGLDDNIGVYIIGGTPTTEYLKLKKDLNLKNVYFKEFMTKKDMSLYFKVADIFILPTREDIWGLVINEAMSYGLPVITTDKCIAGLELVDEKNGSIVSINNKYELRKEIDKILDNEDMIECMGQESLRKIKKYTIENMSKKHISCFKDS